VAKQDAECVIATIVPTAALLALRNRGKVLLFAQDDNETAYDSWLLRRIMHLFYVLAFSLLRVPTVTVSQFLADSFMTRFAGRCRVVNNGVDTTTFYPDPSPELLAAKGGRKALLLYSRRDPRKGFASAQEVAARLHGRDDSLEIWTVGEEPLAGALPARHHHFGNVDEERLRSIMSSADAFLYPSYSEGFPLMVVEAFACKCPVVTTTAIPFARNNENALVSDPGDVNSLTDQVLLIFTDKSMAEKIVEAAYGFALANRLSASSAQFAQEVEMFGHERA
jgi:glycosyltransferase involved in cell wall biosynthesis